MHCTFLTSLFLEEPKKRTRRFIKRSKYKRLKKQGKTPKQLNLQAQIQSSPTALLPSFASHVICAEASPVDPNLVAVGGGDSTIRVWKTASSRPGFDVSLVWQKLSSKVW